MRYPPPMSIDFRPLRESDRAAISAISRATWDGDDFLEKVFDAWIADPASPFLGLFQDGELAGCGRLMPFDRRRAWLEGLRVHPSSQGQGLGRAMAHRLFRLGGERGFEELHFSTYFRNDASIRISEQAGFSRIAAFSHLEMNLAEGPRAEEAEAGSTPENRPDTALSAAAVTAWAPAPSPPAPAPPAVPGFRSMPGWMWNDWLFLPEDLAERSRHFPDPATLTSAGLSIVIARNIKYGPSWLEICGFEGEPGADPGPCLSGALAEARRRGASGLHVMLPSDRPPEPFLAAGFRSFEQTGDVFLFRARTAELRLGS